MIAARPEIADETMRECAELEVKHVWITVVLAPAASRRRQRTTGAGQGIAVIDGGCPCMFGPTADFGHKAMRLVFTLTGNVPKEV